MFRNRNAVIANDKAGEKNPAEAEFQVSVFLMKSRLCGNVRCLETLGSFFYLIGDRLTFVQGFETRTLYRVEMYEYIIAAAVLRSKTKP